MFHWFIASVTVMYRRFRLSTHRKNEFRKRRLQRSVVTKTIRVEQVFQENNLTQPLPGGLHPATPLVVSIPVNAVSVLGVSIDIDVYLRTPLESLYQLKSRLSRMPTLPQGWIDVTDHTISCGLTISKVEGGEESRPASITRSITVSSDLTWHIAVNGNVLTTTATYFSALPQKIVSLQDLLSTLECVDSLASCVGNDDDKFIPLIAARKGSFRNPSGTDIVAYHDISCNTIRCTDCMVLVPRANSASRCEQCRDYRKNMSGLLTRYRNGQTKRLDGSDPQSHTNYRYLSTPEKDKRLQRLHHQHRMSEKKLTRLRAALKQAIEQRAVTVDEGLHQDLQEIIRENYKGVGDAHPPGSFGRLFWENQMRAASVSDARSMRWDPLMIRWCLYLRHLSGSAYEMLRECGVVKLPSQRTLRDYTYTAKAAAGFSREVDMHIMEAAKLLSCPDREKHVILLMDEMHLREDLVYDRHTGSVIGFVNMGDVNTHLQAFEQSLSGERRPIGTLASTMLVLMVRSLFTRLQYPYAQFPCNSLSSDKMFDPLWEAVARLERLGFKVMGLCCDGLAANRRLFALHSEERNAYKIVNPYAEETRNFFFFSDPPHLLKTVRNAWANPKRHLWCDGQDIKWSQLRCLYKRNRPVTETPSLAMLHKVKFEHVNLTSFSKMRVDLAAQVLSSSVANALRVTLKDKATQTANFCDIFDKFFDCLNVTNFDAGKRSRNAFKSPYRSEKDFRLKWLTDKFLPYLDHWEKSVCEREGFSSAEKNKMLLSQETRNGLRITVHSFVELVQYLFSLPDVSLFLSNRLGQDPLEKFFGEQRQRGRVNENPNVVEFLRNTQALRVINTTCANVKGNCRGSNRKRGVDDLENTPIPKRKRTSKT